MKWYEILRGCNISLNKEEPCEVHPVEPEHTPQPVQPVVIPSKDEIVSGVSEEIKSLLENYKPQEAPPDFENTQLNDNQIQKVLDTMLIYQDKYFEATPLNVELIQPFVWNIPKEIFKTHQYVKDHCLPDMMDPIFWFYMFCMKNPEQAMGKYIVQAINSMTDEEFDEISENADEYDSM